MINMVTFYYRLQSPATTKREELRINSSACNSLNLRETVRVGIEVSRPPEMVSKREAESKRLNDNKVLRSEWGSINNVRFMLSSVASITNNASALGNNVYNVFVQGMEALACVEQDNYSARFLYRPPVFSDPLFQNVTIGYVFAEVPRILNDLWITNMRCTLA